MNVVMRDAQEFCRAVMQKYNRKICDYSRGYEGTQSAFADTIK